jgi:deoxyribose-phosphate aldolase
MYLAQYIDHTILKPTTTEEEIKKLCNEAKEFSFAAVCLPPYFVSEALRLLTGTTIKIATVIGFPFGYNHYSAKALEAELAIKDGANEIDMVMNISAFKNKDYDYLKNEIETVLDKTRKGKAVIKIIIESGLLTDDEIIKCCELYKVYEVDFLKTSTGYAEKGASLEAVTLMRKNLPDRIKIKASGGIKTFQFATALIDAGASRLGCSASVAIVQGEQTNSAGY